MNASALLVPRPISAETEAEWQEEKDFDTLVESVKTLFFTSADRSRALDRAVLLISLAEFSARWPREASTLLTEAGTCMDMDIDIGIE